MKSNIRTIELTDGFYPSDGLDDMYRPTPYGAYDEANEMQRTNNRYSSKCVLVKRTVRRYTHS
jgi:hypothetical protein